MVVMKFGGTSVADQTAVERLIAIVRAQRQADAQQEGGDARGPIVVVSALSKVTDRLLGIAANAGAGDIEGAKTNLRDLRQRHTTICKVIVDPLQREQVIQFLDQEFDGLERIVHALAVLREVSPRWLDAIAATGEILSSRIVAAALTSHGLLATWIDARRAVVTTGDHTAAAPLFQETTAALMAHVDPPLAAGRVPVMGGFVGATADGVTTTLGRGGSDYSAAIVGACLGAGEIQIWTDVDGMLTADPRIVGDPFVVPHLSFAEASELAYFGAKVLHPATMAPAVRAGIPIRVLNTWQPDAHGTRVVAQLAAGERGIKSIATKSPIAAVNVVASEMMFQYGFLERIADAFARHEVVVDVIATSEVSVALTVDANARLAPVVAELQAFSEVSVVRDLALVSVVGEELRDGLAVQARIFATLAELSVRAEMASYGATRNNLSIVVPRERLKDVVDGLHERLFQGP
jgi:aspartate kinase